MRADISRARRIEHAASHRKKLCDIIKTLLKKTAIGAK